MYSAVGEDAEGVRGLSVELGEGIAGRIATERKPLSGSAARWPEMAVEDYQELRRRYLALGTETAVSR